MANEYFILYDVASAQEIARMSGPAGSASIQNLGTDRAVIQVTAEWFTANKPLAELPLSDVIVSLRRHAKTIRETLVFAGAQTSHGVVDTSAYSLAMLTVKRTLAAAVNPDTEMSFTMADNSVVTMFADDLVEMIDEALTWVDSIHNHARALRQTLDAAETTTAALQVDVFRGWPVILTEKETNQ